MFNQYETAADLISDNKEAGSKKIRAMLELSQFDLDSKAITALLAEAGIGKTSSKWTQENTLKFIEGGVSEFDLYEKILEEGARNEARWINDRNKIRATMNRIYANFDEPVTEVAATEQQKEDIKDLVAGK